MYFPKVVLLVHVLVIIQMMNRSSIVVSTDDVALLAIKSKITDDPEKVLKSWNASLPFCQWQGVTCGRRHQRVTKLRLRGKSLVGTLSPYVGNLSFLRSISLDDNHFQERIPPEIGRLFRLETLSLPNNSFTGEIPANISSCSKLLYLNLEINKLTGKIPNIFTSLHMLNAFSFGKNNLTGGIPPSIGNLTSLEHVFFPRCPLGGRIPDSFRQLKNLRRLGLGEMGLVGPFPSFLFNLSKLEHINFPVNELYGSLPSTLCLSQPHLQRLEMGYNHFTGFLPLSISNCSELESFDVSYNNFNGEITTDYGKLPYFRWLTIGPTYSTEGFGGMKYFDSLSNCSNLQVLDIEEVQLRRELPDWLGNLTKLRYLILESNYISGNLPPSIGNLVNLIVFSLAGNNFTGMIPENIGKLRNVGELSLARNHFSGIIPRYIGNLSSLTKLLISRNNLEGTIPPTIGKCTNLIRLSLSGNNLEGSIPKEIFQLSSLSVQLDLSQNSLSGVLPQEIGTLKNLGTLDLSENRLGGELPSSLSSCISLQFLYLSRNFLNGSMPEALRSLRGLEDVDLSGNNFSGYIPKYFQEISLKHLDLSYNDFEGEVSLGGVFANTSAISITGNPKLCGGIPELHLPKCTSTSDIKNSRKLSIGVVVAISVSSTIAGIVLVSSVLFYCFEKKRTQKKKGIPSDLMLTETFEKISYATLFKATQGFSSQNLIGTGSYASVYKGVLEENCLNVAVKVLKLKKRGGSKSFIAECEALRNIRHRNLVKILTLCSSIDFQGNDFKALLYDFMPNGNLDSWLHSSTISLTNHDDELRQLDIVQRISIAKDVACALDYLHYGCGKVVVHCDLKPSNILLDADMIAHVGDFGLAKIISLEDANGTTSSLIRGTIGYAPPEYGLGNEVSTSGDMYSYGILLLEMMTGKKPVDPMFQEGLSLHSYARTALADGFVLQIVDPMLLDDDVTGTCLSSLIKIGVQCSSGSPHDRMNMRTVIHELLSVTNRYKL